MYAHTPISELNIPGLKRADGQLTFAEIDNKTVEVEVERGE